MHACVDLLRVPLAFPIAKRARIDAKEGGHIASLNTSSLFTQNGFPKVAAGFCQELISFAFGS
eukprot:9414610-Lingulodinium_polyedra.AAC.1